jgi:hypothetical protein
MQVEHAIGVLLALAVLAVATGFAWRALRRPAPIVPEAVPAPLDTLASWQPQATRLLTSGEREAFDVLRRAFPRHLVMAQVPLARFLRVPTRYSYKEWLRRIGHQCADLVLCDATTQVVAVVAVRAAKPQGERTRRRHARLVKVLEAAEIPLHVWVEGALPSAEGARRQFGLTDAVGVAPAVVPAAVTAATAELALADGGAGLPSRPAPLDARTRQPAVPDEVIEMREPPNSTWFDEFDSRTAPLDETRPPTATPKS